jgi:hypothetical protein
MGPLSVDLPTAEGGVWLPQIQNPNHGTSLCLSWMQTTLALEPVVGKPFFLNIASDLRRL